MLFQIVVYLIACLFQLFYVLCDWQEDMRQESRKRNLLILMLSYLSENGYIESAASLEKEGNLSLSRWQVVSGSASVLVEYTQCCLCCQSKRCL